MATVYSDSQQRYRRFELVRCPQSLRAQDDGLLADLCVNAVGYFEEAHDHHVIRDGFDEYVLIYCSGGKGFYRSLGRQWDVEAGQLLVAMPLAHEYWAAKETPWTIHWLHVCGQHAEPLLREAGIATHQPVQRLGEQLGIQNLIREALSSLQDGINRRNRLHAASCGRMLLTRLIGLAHERSQATNGAFDLPHVLSYMRARIEQPVTLAELAAEGGLSVSHFSRLFSEAHGQSPMECFSKMRIDAACELLDHSKQRIHSVARMVGIADPHYFSRVFRKYQGVSPRQYRSRHHDRPTGL